MNGIVVLVFLFAVIGNAVGLYLAPRLSRSSLFFGVTVDPEFRLSSEARQISEHFRKRILLIAGIGLALLAATAPFTNAYGAIPLIFITVVQMTVGGMALGEANKRARAFAKPPAPSRTASLQPRTRTLPGGWPLLLGPMIIVAVAALLVFSRRAALRPEAYSAAWSPLLVAASMSLLFLWLAWIAIFRTRQINVTPEADGEENTFRRTGYFLLVAIAYSLTIPQVVMALSVAGILPQTSIAGAVPASTALAIVVLVLVARRRHGSAETVRGDGTPDACWKWGMFYYNREDPAFLVEKRIGFGWTLNYGNKWSWVLSAGLIIGPFVLRYFWFR